MPPDYGPFTPLFAPSGRYLALLHLQSDGSAAAVQTVKHCAQQSTHPQHDLHTLLTDFNWRPTLVACIAVLFVKPDPAIITSLWDRLDAGSWVAPQIAVVLSQIDPHFMDHARARLEAQCPIHTAELHAMSPLVRHSAAGPAGLNERSAKTAHALASLASQHTPRPPWLETLTTSPAYHALIAQDRDHADKIAQNWQQRLTHILQTLPE